MRNMAADSTPVLCQDSEWVYWGSTGTSKA